ncbi:MAG: TAT-variant-translocated molybdopterin oxidoreductase [Planctomycetota bacterium]
MSTRPPQSSISSQSGSAYWRSLNEYAGSPEARAALTREFPSYDPDELLAMGRRKFMQLAGASMALAGLTLTGCRRWPKEQVLPYNARPDGTMPGVPETFASMVQRGGYARGTFVTSFDGRPIKVDGNPLDPTVGDPETARILAETAKSGDVHAQNKLNAFVGVADARAQAMTLEMYDPDRSRSVMTIPAVTRDPEGDLTKVQPEFSSWDDFVAAGVFQANVAVLAEPMSGLAAATAKVLFGEKFGHDHWHTWSPLNRDCEIEGSKLAFGRALRAQYDVSKAKVIAAFDCDFLHEHPSAIANARGWAKNRKSADNADPTMNRMYAAGVAFTPTLASADEHVQVRPSKIAVMLDHLANKLGVPGVSSASDLNGQTLFIEKLAKDLKSAKGESIVVAGASQPAEVHALVWAINDYLGNLGSTIITTEDPAGGALQTESIAALAEKLHAGEVDTLLVLGGNPVYDAPAALNFADAIRKAKTVVRLGLYFDETSAAADWHLPEAHPLESWGDGQAWNGTLLLQQPLIEPMFGGKSAIEVVALATGDAKTTGFDLVRRSWSSIVGTIATGQLVATSRADGETGIFDGPLTGLEAEKTWRKFVHDGMHAGSHLPKVSAKPAPAKPASGSIHAADAESFEAVFVPGPAYDGRHANNGWLQELPQPFTKVCWDTPAHLAVADCKTMGLQNGDHVAVTVAAGGDAADVRVELPVYVNPGQAPGTVVLPLGGGRPVTGNVGTGVGHDVYPLRLHGEASAIVKIDKVRGYTELATTTDHHLIDPERLDTGGTGAVENWALQKRAGKFGKEGYIIKEATLAEYIQNRNFANDDAHLDVRLQLFQTPSVTNPGDPDFVQPNPDGPDAFNVPHAWGMAVDLASCIGCNACVVACTAENNIPVVGKDQVLKSREMHWLRVDHYLKGDPEATSSDELYAVQMPVSCVHCENAPCEQVCPVAATVHDTEGLNTMVYNRCIGTRYCANNCPYKVRRFNYFDYHSKLDSDFFRSKNVGVEVQNKPWLAFPDMQQGDVIDQVRRMMFNPDVTVRMRGVMEKCTYCTQRITRTKIVAKADWARRKTLAEQAGKPMAEHPTDEDRLLQDGEIRTACQTACPTDCISFGNLNDPAARVSIEQQRNPRSYRLLEELNHRARTEYLAKLTNPVKPRKAKKDGAYGDDEPKHKADDHGDEHHHDEHAEPAAHG